MDFFKPENLFRAQNRLRQDWRVLRIEDPQDFLLFARRKELGISGIVYRYPVTDEMRIAASEWAANEKTSRNIDDNMTRVQLTAMFDDYIHIKKRKSADPETIRQRLLKSGFPVPLQPPAIDLVTMWQKITANSTEGWYASAHLRLNSEEHRKWLQHHPAATLLLSGDGTLIKNPSGKIYQTEPDDLFLFDNLEHCAPPLKRGQPDRINYVFGLDS